MNTKKKLFVVSDIHGHYTLLKEALANAGFDNKNENHLLICCGDYFDRGNENVEVLKFFERLNHKVLLRGNHEDLLLELLNTGKIQPHNYINGTMATIENFFGKHCVNPIDDTIDFSGKTGTVTRICEFIKETIDYFETQNYVFVHGWIPIDSDTVQQRAEISKELWGRSRWQKWTSNYFNEPPLEDKTLVCGHVPTFRAIKFDENRSPNDASIFYGNGLIAIDAGTYDMRQVNVLVLEDELM